MSSWREEQPIYRQLRDRMANAIMDGTLKDGDPLPSVRVLAMDHAINPLTVSKGYAELVAEGLVEKRRGLGMFVIEGARAQLLNLERKKFIEEDWPRTLDHLRTIGLDLKDLPGAANEGDKR